VWSSGRVSDGMRSGWKHYEIPYFHPRRPTSAHTLLIALTLPRTECVWLNRLRTDTEVWRFRSCLHKWGMAPSAACGCSAEEQTVDYVVLQRPIDRPSHGLHGLAVLDDKTIGWLLNTCPEISVAKQWQRCTESEIFDSDSAPASAEYTPTPLRLWHILKFGLRLLLKLQSELSKLLAVSKRPCPVFALKRLKKRIKWIGWSLHYKSVASQIKDQGGHNFFTLYPNHLPKLQILTINIKR